GSQDQISLIPKTVALGAATIAYECLVLMIVNRALKRERSLPSWIWYVNTLIETMLPTAAILMITHSSFIGPYRALVAPAALLYFYFIILSTLELSPLLSALTGLLSFLEYAALTAYTYHRFPPSDFPEAVFPLSVYGTYAIVILTAGLIAAGVAAQIRKHVTAALTEAETRRRIELVERDLNIARSIQQGLLPGGSPPVEPFEIAGWSQPADETGGDYFDWQQLPDGRLAVSLADVTGHGIGPALVTAVCRAYSRASFPSGQEVGAVVALLDPKTSSVDLLSAGHGPLLLYTAADGQLQDFSAHGIPLGLLSGAAYGAPQRICMATGDVLVLLTDGFFEWANAQREQFGLDRLRHAILETKDLTGEQIIAELYARVKRFVGDQAQQDDLTAVVIKRNAEPPVASRA
ncbi:MAG: PP2C family protein-serine/threonine phosphatase, partial [Planctomycetota bacterium]